MDIGTEASTEFDMTPDVISYMTDNDLLDYQVGLIHSHHSMSTFFSGVDTNTLLEEGIDRAHFVSLIVNNKGSYTAGITRRVTATYNIKEVQVLDDNNNLQIKMLFDKIDMKSTFKDNYFDLN